MIKKDKGAGGKSAKPVEYQRFLEILNKVIKAPPMQKSKEA